MVGPLAATPASLGGVPSRPRRAPDTDPPERHRLPVVTVRRARRLHPDPPSGHGTAVMLAALPRSRKNSVRRRPSIAHPPWRSIRSNSAKPRVTPGPNAGAPLAMRDPRGR